MEGTNTLPFLDFNGRETQGSPIKVRPNHETSQRRARRAHALRDRQKYTP